MMKSTQMSCSINSKQIDVRATARIIVFIVFTIAIFVCGICNYAISRSFTWSLYPISSIIFMWIISFPLFYMDSNQKLLSLSLLSAFIIPYLFILYKIMGSPDLFMEIGVGAAISTVLYLWVIYFLFIKVKKYLAISISLLLAIPVSFIINYIVGYYTIVPSIDIVDIFIDIALVIGSVLSLYIGSRKKQFKA